MNWAVFLTQAAPSARWRLGKLMTKIVYSRAFESIGQGTVITKPLVMRGVERIRLGKNCAVYERSWLAAENGATLTVGDDVYMGHDVHIHAIDDILIGAGTSLTDGVLISNGEHDRDQFSIVQGTGPISIGNGCFLGQRAVVLGGVTIGDGARIGVGAVVTRDIPAGATAVGVPARVISSVGNEITKTGFRKKRGAGEE